MTILCFPVCNIHVCVCVCMCVCVYLCVVVVFISYKDCVNNDGDEGGVFIA